MRDVLFFMLHPKEEEFRKFILPLYLLMQLSGKAYAKYMNNKIYLHALDDQSVFPKQAEQKIFDYYFQLKKEIKN